MFFIASERESGDLGVGMDLKGFSTYLAFLLLTGRKIVILFPALALPTITDFRGDTREREGQN